MTGQELKSWRTGAGYTQAEGAKALGVTRVTVARAEAEPDAPLSPKLAGKLAQVRAPQGEASKPKPEPKAVLAQAEAKAAHLATPKPSARQLAARAATKGMQIGATRPPYGSMLKGGKAKR